MFGLVVLLLDFDSTGHIKESVNRSTQLYIISKNPGRNKESLGRMVNRNQESKRGKEAKSRNAQTKEVKMIPHKEVTRLTAQNDRVATPIKIYCTLLMTNPVHKQWNLR